MPRTEKRFGVVNQPTASTPTELVPTATTTRNVLINATARTTAAISAAIYSGAYSNDATGNIVVSSFSVIYAQNSTAMVDADTVMSYLGRDNVYSQGIGSNANRICVIDPNTNSIMYVGNTNTVTLVNYFRQNLGGTRGIKEVSTGNSTFAQLTQPYKMVSSSKGLGIAGNLSTVASSYMLDSISITNTGTSITESGDGVGPLLFQGATSNAQGAHSAGIYALQDGVGFAFHGGAAFTSVTANYTALGIYIYSNSSTSFGKRAYWLTDGTANKTVGLAMSYFIASDYSSTSNVFAFSQPSTTTLWSGISPTSNTSWPAGYTLPSAAAPAGFRIVSNSNTVAPTDTNFLTGTITYPSAPTGVNVPTGQVPVSCLKFSPDGTKLAVGYRRDYSGTGNTNSVVVVYTKQGDGSWLHTDSSGSRFPYQPHSTNAMEWSGDSGSIAIFSTNNSTSESVAGAATNAMYVWNLSSGTIGFVSNSTISTWTNLSTKFPDFYDYIKPITGSSTISSVSTTTYNLTFTYTLSNRIFGSLHWARTASSGSAGQFIACIQSGQSSTKHQGVQAAIMIPSGTVGVSNQPASNYVTTVVSDLALIPGQTSQVSNIVLGSGERLYVESSTSNSVDVSAHGVEVT